MVLSAILKKLLFVRQFNINDGKITLLGDRQVMLSSSAILELQEIDETKMYDIGKKSSLKNLVKIVDHAKVYSKVKDVFVRKIASLGKKIGESDEGAIKVLQDVFNVYGLGEMHLQKLDNRSKQALVMIDGSTIAEEYRKKNKKKSSRAVCALTAGVIAGIFSYIFDKKVDCVETKCKAKSGSYCLFKVG